MASVISSGRKDVDVLSCAGLIKTTTRLAGDMFLLESEDVLKLAIAVVVGGIVGAEREYRDKAAGFRTIIFICVGATLFTIFSTKLAFRGDPTRIAANIVTGIGFLGAGAILRHGNRIVGLTTASTIWFVAALGMGIGGGQFLFVAAATGAALVVLWIFPWFERFIDRASETRTYEVTCALESAKFEQLERLFRELGLKIASHRQTKSGNEMTCIWRAWGSLKDHDRITQALLQDEEVKAFSF